MTDTISRAAVLRVLARLEKYAGDHDNRAWAKSWRCALSTAAQEVQNMGREDKTTADLFAEQEVGA